MAGGSDSSRAFIPLKPHGTPWQAKYPLEGSPSTCYRCGKTAPWTQFLPGCVAAEPGCEENDREEYEHGKT